MDIDAYLRELARRAGAVLGDALVGAYAGGSYALGAYEHGRSDLDVAVVVAERLGRGPKEALVAELRHESLPCPARGLELVVYSRAAAASTDVAPDFELNLNTGARMPFREDFQPDPAEGHWFAIDREILRTNGIALVGPTPDAIFGIVPRQALLAVVAQSLRWHESGEAEPDDAVLNACRALRFARTGEWASKPVAGAWALDNGVGSPVVAKALAARSGAGRVPPDAARDFVAWALEAVT